jgi:hypothetical protein
MKYENGIIRADHCLFRLIHLDDSEFVVNLRNETRRSRFISKSAETADAQREWIRSYLPRHEAGHEYYFIACDLNNTPWGTVRLYDIGETECTGGSWVMLDGAPLSISLETYLLPMWFAFHVLSKKVLHIDVRKANTRVCKWHEMCGAELLREDGLDRYYYYTPESYSIARRIVHESI